MVSMFSEAFAYIVPINFLIPLKTHAIYFHKYIYINVSPYSNIIMLSVLISKKMWPIFVFYYIHFKSSC